MLQWERVVQSGEFGYFAYLYHWPNGQTGSTTAQLKMGVKPQFLKTMSVKLSFAINFGRQSTNDLKYNIPKFVQFFLSSSKICSNSCCVVNNSSIFGQQYSIR